MTLMISDWNFAAASVMTGWLRGKDVDMHIHVGPSTRSNTGHIHNHPLSWQKLSTEWQTPQGSHTHTDREDLHEQHMSP